MTEVVAAAEQVFEAFAVDDPVQRLAEWVRRPWATDDRTGSRSTLGRCPGDSRHDHREHARFEYRPKPRNCCDRCCEEHE